jgi:hypothetical protein
MCPVMLRRLFDSPSQLKEAWPRLSDGTTRALTHGLLALAVTPELTAGSRKKLCMLVGAVAKGVLPEGGWPDLLSSMVAMVRSQDQYQKEVSLSLFAILVTALQGKVQLDTGLLISIFLATLSDPSSRVRIAALSACASLISTFDKKEVVKLSELCPPMMSCLQMCLQEDEEAGQETLETLLEVLETRTKFFKKHFADVFRVMGAIASTWELEEATRHLAIEFVLVYAEFSPAMVRKMPEFCLGLMPLLLRMLITEEDDAEWASKNEDDEEEAASDEGIAGEALDRVALALGGATILPALWPLVQEHLGSPDWKKRRAALVCLSCIAEGCVRQFEGQLGELVALTCRHLAQDPHHRVRHAALQCIGQLCTDFSPVIQEQHNAALVPALCSAMIENAASPRVQAYAAATVINFTSECPEDVLKGFLDQLLSSLFVLLNTPHQAVQEDAITAIASIAGAASTHMAKYYDALMPGLKAIVTAPISPSRSLMRGKAIECVGLVATAVGRDLIVKDAHEIMQAIISQGTFDPAITAARAAADPNDSQVVSYMMHAAARIATAIKAEFLPYLDHVLPSVLAVAEQTVEMSVVSGEDAPTEDNVKVMSLSFGDKRIVIPTAALEDKSSACHILVYYAEALEQHFLRYVEPVAKILVPLLTFYYHDDARTAAARGMPALLACVRRAGESSLVADGVVAAAPGSAAPGAPQAGGPGTPGGPAAASSPSLSAAAASPSLGAAPPGSPSLVVASPTTTLEEPATPLQPAWQTQLQGLWGFMAGKFLKAIHAEADPEVLSEMLTSFAECLGYLGPDSLTAEHYADLDKTLPVLLEDMAARLAELEQRRKEEDFDSEDNDAFEGERLLEGDLSLKIADFIGAFVRTQGASAIPSISKVTPQLVAMAAPSRPEAERHCALLVFDDLVQFQGPLVRSFLGQYIALAGPALSDASAKLRQAAAYGIGWAAVHADASLAGLWPNVLQALAAMVAAPESRGPAMMTATATDNAIAAFGRILRHQSQHVQLAAELQRLVSWLPLTDDASEGPNLFKILLDFLQSGQFPWLLPRILDLAALQFGSDFMDEETEARIAGLASSINIQAVEGLSESSKVALSVHLHNFGKK